MIRIQSSKTFGRFAILIFLVVALYFGFTFFTQYQTLGQQNREIASLQAQLTHIQNSNESLRRQIENTQTQDYIASVARDKLGWVKPGEILFIESTPQP